MTAKATKILIYAVRARVVLKYLGLLSLSLAAMALVPLLVALLYGEPHFALRLGVVSAVLTAAGMLLSRLPGTKRLQVNEALVVTALLFVIACASMTWPLMAGHVRFVDAVFESVSAITSTGLTTLASVEDKTPVFLFTRAWLQWYGGFAIVVLALALVLEPGAVTKRFASGEVQTDDLVGNTRLRAQRAIVIYAALTITGFAATWAFGLDAFDALLHSLTAVSTAGFSTRDDSLASFGWPVQTVLTFISLAGALSFSLYYDFWRRGWRRLAYDQDLWALLVAAVLAGVLVALFEVLAKGFDWRDILPHALFLSFSAQTTTGFSTTSVAALDPASKLVLMVSMFIGGDVGSTAGGIKIVRFLVILRLLQFIVVRVSLPRHAVAHVEMGGRRLEDANIRTALTVVIAFIVLVGFSWLLFLALGQPALDALFEVVSATATTGLSAGVASPELHPLLKSVLCIDMLAGRLEIVALVILLYPRSWFGRREDS